MKIPGEWRQRLESLHKELSDLIHKNLVNAETSILSPSAKTSNKILNQADVSKIRRQLESLSGAPIDSISKISQLQRLLESRIEFRDLENILVPIERVLDWDRDDGQLLLQTDGESLRSSSNSSRRATIPLKFCLDHIRSAFNVGSVFRLAECVGAEELFLLGYTPGPENPRVQRSALGCESVVPWKHLGRVEELLPERNRTKLIALETAPSAISIYDDFPPEPCIFVVGNERFGLSPSIIKSCDEVRSIPMLGAKKSLNVAQALAVAAFEWKRQYELRSKN